MDPPEPKFLMPDSRLKREVFLLNIDRLRKIGMGIYDIMQYIQYVNYSPFVQSLSLLEGHDKKIRVTLE